MAWPWNSKSAASRDAVASTALDRAHTLLAEERYEQAGVQAEEGLAWLAEHRRPLGPLHVGLTDVLVAVARVGEDHGLLVTRLRSMIELLRAVSPREVEPWHRQLVAELDKAGALDEATTELELELGRWEAANPAAAAAERIRGELAEHYWNLGRRGDALSLWRRAAVPSGLAQSPAESTLAQHIVADALVQMDRHDEATAICPDWDYLVAAEDWAGLARLAPRDVRQMVLGALAQARSGQAHNAVPVLLQLEQVLRGSDELALWQSCLRALAEAEEQAGLHDSALTHATAALTTAMRLWGRTSAQAAAARLALLALADSRGQREQAVQQAVDILTYNRAALLAEGGAQHVQRLEERLTREGLRIPESTGVTPEQGFSRWRRRILVSERSGRTAEAMRECLLLGEALARAGRTDDAADVFRHAVELAPQLELGALPLIEATNGLAMAVESTRDITAALALYEENLRRAERELGQHHGLTRVLRANLADTKEATGAIDDAGWLFGHNVLAPREELGSAGITDRIRLGWIALRANRPVLAFRIARRALTEALAAGEPDLLLGAAALLCNIAEEPDIGHEMAWVLEQIAAVIERVPAVAEGLLPLQAHVLNLGAELALSADKAELALGWLRQATELIEAHPSQELLSRQFFPRIAEAYIDAGDIDAALTLLLPLRVNPALGGPDAVARNEDVERAWARAVAASGQPDPAPQDFVVQLPPDEQRGQYRGMLLAREARIHRAEPEASVETNLQRYSELAADAADVLPHGDFVHGLITVRIAALYEAREEWDKARYVLLAALDEYEAYGEWTSVAGVMVTARALWQLRYVGDTQGWCALVARDTLLTGAERGWDSAMSQDCLARLAYALAYVGEPERAAEITALMAAVYGADETG